MQASHFESRSRFHFLNALPRSSFSIDIKPLLYFDVGKDGRFLIPTQTEQAVSGPMNVVLNWTAGLKK